MVPWTQVINTYKLIDCPKNLQMFSSHQWRIKTRNGTLFHYTRKNSRICYISNVLLFWVFNFGRNCEVFELHTNTVLWRLLPYNTVPCKITDRYKRQEGGWIWRTQIYLLYFGILEPKKTFLK